MKDRKRNRLQFYDYSKPGYYFVTICVKEHRCAFGRIREEKVILNKAGKFAKKCWVRISQYYNNVVIDEFVVMPNHIHGILIINESPTVGTEHCSVLVDTNKHYGLLSKIVMSYKNVVTKGLNKVGVSDFQWQRSFYDYIIRSDQVLLNVREYIHYNPLKWELEKNDSENFDYKW